MESGRLGLGLSALHFNKPSRRFWGLLKFENYCLRNFPLVQRWCCLLVATLELCSLTGTPPSKLDWEVRVLQLTLPAFEGLTFVILFLLKHPIKLMLALKFKVHLSFK